MRITSIAQALAGGALAAALVAVPPPGAAGQSPATSSPAALVEHPVAGRAAWEEASRRGFEFYPVIPGEAFILSGKRDGAQTTLKACPNTGGACAVEAQLLDGEMIVLPPGCDGCVRSHVFEMFAGRPLAEGWALKRVELKGASRAWARPPRPGSRNASFAVRLEARGEAASSVTIARLVLVGPAGADWRRAFDR